VVLDYLKADSGQSGAYGEKHRGYFDPTRAAKAMDRQIIDR
jgi:hypothetical protein